VDRAALSMFAIGPQRTWALALHMSAFIQMRTYTEIYARISADPPPSGAIIFVCGRRSAPRRWPPQQLPLGSRWSRWV